MKRATVEIFWQIISTTLAFSVRVTPSFLKKKKKKTLNAYSLKCIASLESKSSGRIISSITCAPSRRRGNCRGLPTRPPSNMQRNGFFFSQRVCLLARRDTAGARPRHEPSTGTFLQKLEENNVVDKQCTSCTPLRLSDRQIETCVFWHDHLILLKQAFDQSQPATLSQWWYDRRNGAQWHAFWIAVVVLFLTIFFGIVQSIEAELQVYKECYPTVV